MAASKIIIERLPLRTSPQDRFNSYNHHALAPWLAETSYITPLYLHRREALRTPFNMARWPTPAVETHMLAKPEAVLQLSTEQIQTLLTVAAISEYGKKDVSTIMETFDEMEKQFDPLPGPQCDCLPPDIFFVRMSTCSPKDADGGNQRSIFTIAEAIFKIISSKRTVQTMIDLLAAPDTVDNKIYFFPYIVLDKLSEWRCFIYESRVVAISQSRFYQANHEGIEDGPLKLLVRQAQKLWDDMAPELSFDSCILDLYAEVRDPSFRVKLIELNPWGPYLGTGSMLFHWLDDANILEPTEEGMPTTVVRIVNPDNTKTKDIDRDTAFMIGRASIIEEELACLEKRGLLGILKIDEAQRLMKLPIPASGNDMIVTRKGALEKFRRKYGTKEAGSEAARGNLAPGPEFHPRFLKVQKAYQTFLSKKGVRTKEIE